MKKLFLGAAALVFATGLFAQKKANDVAKFKSETIEMGKLQVSKPETVIFNVLNVGKEPLIIEAATPTCGCTIGDYTKAPIAPGKSGEIKATYNAANLGTFEKHLTVKFAGVDEIKSITIKGEVLSAEDYAKTKGLPAPATVASKTTTVTTTPTTTTKTTVKTNKSATKPTVKKVKTKTKSIAKI